MDIVTAHPEVMNVHDLIVHDYGPGRLMVSLHAEVPGDGDIYALHDAIDTAEYELESKLGCAAVIHMDPVSPDGTKTAHMRDELAEELTKKVGYPPVYQFQIGAAIAINAGPRVVGAIFETARKKLIKEEKSKEKNA